MRSQGSRFGGLSGAGAATAGRVAQRWKKMAVTSGVFMALLGGTIVNIAFPSIRAP
jgi:hypothetical protein